ncbi:MAG: hypothetical protein HC860_13605 [Alkalinema sp. RU_4_3]|nr:hypothetical protein [Alkalinema sp. RU_4_3]
MSNLVNPASFLVDYDRSRSTFPNPSPFHFRRLFGLYLTVPLHLQYQPQLQYAKRLQPVRGGVIGLR